MKLGEVEGGILARNDAEATSMKAEASRVGRGRTAARWEASVGRAARWRRWQREPGRVVAQCG